MVSVDMAQPSAINAFGVTMRNSGKRSPRLDGLGVSLAFGHLLLARLLRVGRESYDAGDN